MHDDRRMRMRKIKDKDKDLHKTFPFFEGPFNF